MSNIYAPFIEKATGKFKLGNALDIYSEALPPQVIIGIAPDVGAIDLSMQPVAAPGAWQVRHYDDFDVLIATSTGLSNDWIEVFRRVAGVDIADNLVAYNSVWSSSKVKDELDALSDAFTGTEGLAEDIIAVQAALDENPDVLSALQRILLSINLPGYENFDYVWAIIDDAKNILASIDKYGKFKARLDIASLPDELKVFSDGSIKVDNIENHPYAWAVVDNEENILLAVDINGKLVAKFPDSIGPSEPIDFVAELGNNGLSVFSTNELELTNKIGYQYSWAVVDNDGNILLAVDINGELVAKLSNTATDSAFNDYGLSAFVDKSIESTSKTGYPYAWALTDAQDRLLLSVDESGTISTTQAKIAGIESYAESKYENYQFAVVDDNEQVLYGVDDAGNFNCKPSDSMKLSLGVKSDAASDQTSVTDTYVFSAEKTDDAAVLIAQDISTQKVSTILATNGIIDNLSSVGNEIYFTHDGVSKWAKFPEFSPYRVMPTKSIVCWGDSLTSLVYTTKLTELAGINLVNKGIGGQTSSQIAARAGAIPIVVEAVGDTIGVDIAAVQLSSISQPPITEQYLQWLNGSINGVFGTLSRDSGNVFYFTRSEAGSAIDTTGGVTFIPTLDGLDDRIAFLWLGRNDYSQPATVLANIAATIETLKPKARRFIISSVLNGAGEVTGTSAHTDIVTNINAQLAATYPNNFVDVRQELINAYDSGVAQDVIDHDGDTVPSSLRLDNIHINETGAHIVATLVYNFAVSKGWL